VQVILKKMGQRVTFTLTRDTNEPLIFSKQLDIGRERKFRIWHEFWDTVIRQDSELRIPLSKELRVNGNENQNQNENENEKEEEELGSNPNRDDIEYEPKHLGFQFGGSPPYLMDFEGTIGERHAENKEIIEHESFRSFQSMLSIAVQTENEEMTQLMDSMKYIVSNLNGLDVFWDGPCADLSDEASDSVKEGKLVDNGSQTKFGKMYIVPFPFCAVFLSDDCENATALLSTSPVIAGKIFDAKKGMQFINHLVARNADPEIQRRKGVRLQLRALEESMCHWPIQKYKHKMISRQVQYTDNEGNTKTRTESKTVRVLFSFNDGQFMIGRHGSKAMWQDVNVTKGFVSQLRYRDGRGSHTESGWGTTNWSNEPITVLGEDFGLNAQFEETPMFQQFMGQNYREDIHEPKRQMVIQQFARYSTFYRQQFVVKEQTLSYAFWYYIYNNDSIEKMQLLQLLQMEQNTKLHALTTDGEYLESVSMVFEKLQFFNSSKRHGVWFIFWHDLWMNNMFMPPFVANEDFLSPFKASSICYQYIEDKADLIKQLEDKKVCFKASNLRKGWVNRDIVDMLYSKMDECTAMDLTEDKGPGDKEKNEENEKEEEEQQCIHIDKVRRCSTVRLHGNIALEEEYKRACRMITNICNLDQ